MKEEYCTMKTTARVGQNKYEIVNFVQIARDLIFLNWRRFIVTTPQGRILQHWLQVLLSEILKRRCNHVSHVTFSSQALWRKIYTRCSKTYRSVCFKYDSFY